MQPCRGHCRQHKTRWCGSCFWNKHVLVLCWCVWSFLADRRDASEGLWLYPCGGATGVSQAAPLGDEPWPARHWCVDNYHLTLYSTLHMISEDWEYIAKIVWTVFMILFGAFASIFKLICSSCYDCMENMHTSVITHLSHLFPNRVLFLCAF